MQSVFVIATKLIASKNYFCKEVFCNNFGCDGTWKQLRTYSICTRTKVCFLSLTVGLTRNFFETGHVSVFKPYAKPYSDSGWPPLNSGCSSESSKSTQRRTPLHDTPQRSKNKDTLTTLAHEQFWQFRTGRALSARERASLHAQDPKHTVLQTFTHTHTDTQIRKTPALLCKL